MGRLGKQLFFVFAVSVAGATWGGEIASDTGDDPAESLVMQCQAGPGFEWISIDQGSATLTGDVAAVRTFPNGLKVALTTNYKVRSGEVAECVLPSGNRVRVKVGTGRAYAWGACGADPEVYASVWVNRRKVISRTWFAGHCYEDSLASTFSLMLRSDGRITRCAIAIPPVDTAGKPSDLATPVGMKKSIKACVEFPDASRFPVDQVEYPNPRAKAPPKVGSVEIVRGKDPVCGLVSRVLANEFSATPAPSPKLDRPEWKATTALLPESLKGSVESVFDFDNDGKPDRVFLGEFETHYMEGTVLLVEPPGRDVAPLGPTSYLVPCQMDARHPRVSACPPLSQEGDEAGVLMRGDAGHGIFFRGRYSSVEPFFYRGMTYLELKTTAEATEEFMGVLKPLPRRRTQQVCLLRHVPENF